MNTTFIALVLLALENLFSIGMDDQLEIWKRKTWIVTERSWDVSASRVSSWLEKWDISLIHPDWFIYAVKDTLLSGVQGSFDKLRGSLSFEFFYHFSSVSRYWFRVIAFKDRGGT